MTRTVMPSTLRPDDLGQQIEIPHLGDTKIVGTLTNLQFARSDAKTFITTVTISRRERRPSHHALSDQHRVYVNESE